MVSHELSSNNEVCDGNSTLNMELKSTTSRFYTKCQAFEVSELSPICSILYKCDRSLLELSLWVTADKNEVVIIKFFYNTPMLKKTPRKLKKKELKNKDSLLHHNFFINITSGILTMQYKFCNVFIGHKNCYNSLQLTVYMGDIFATSKWNGHNIVHKNYSYLRFFKFFVAIYHMCALMNLLVVHKKRNIQFLILFVC